MKAIVFLKKYRYVLTGKMLLLFLFFPFLIQAQDHNDGTDSLRKYLSDAIDSTVQSNTDSPPNEENETDNTEQSKTKYFLDKGTNTGQDDSLQFRSIPDSIINRMHSDKDFWYANSTFEKQKNQGKGNDNSSDKIPLTQRTWFQTLLWLIIIGGFSAFVMIYLANSDVNLFRKKQKRIADVTGEDEDTGDIFAINYQKEIDRAVSNNNYRVAVRLMFLRLLKTLSEKNIIQYKQGRTNFDYLLQLTPTSYYTDFFKLTRNYEYSWYGHFDVDAEKFNVIKNDFEKFEHRLG